MPLYEAVARALQTIRVRKVKSTGIAFGMLPAARAARLDPVDALRFE